MTFSKHALSGLLVCAVICFLPMWIGSGCVKNSTPTTPVVATPPPIQVPLVASVSAVSVSGEITIDSPFDNSSVPLTFTVMGQARVFESALQVRVKDALNQVVSTHIVTATAPDIGQFGAYSQVVTLPMAGWYTVEAFSQSAKDGSEINLVSIQVQGV